MEKNWEGPLAVNRQVDVTLEQWRELEGILPASARESYRFQMGLLRAYYDAYVKRRLIRETELESRALNLLRTDAGRQRRAGRHATRPSSALPKRKPNPSRPIIKQKCERLADSLFEKIGSQTSASRSTAHSIARAALSWMASTSR